MIERIIWLLFIFRWRPFVKKFWHSWDLVNYIPHISVSYYTSANIANILFLTFKWLYALENTKTEFISRMTWPKYLIILHLTILIQSGILWAVRHTQGTKRILALRPFLNWKFYTNRSEVNKYELQENKRFVYISGVDKNLKSRLCVCVCG